MHLVVHVLQHKPTHTPSLSHIHHRYAQPSQEWILLFRGSQDGFHARKFHSCCDEKGATVVVVKVSQPVLHNTVLRMLCIL